MGARDKSPRVTGGRCVRPGARYGGGAPQSRCERVFAGTINAAECGTGEIMSLELKGKVVGNVRRYVAKADNTNDGKTALVDIDIVLTEIDAEALGGKLFRNTCFSDFVGKSGATTVDYKTIGGELAIKSEHTVEIDTYKLTAKPKITGLTVGASVTDRAVVLSLRFPVSGAAKKLRRLLDDGVGDDVALNFLGLTQQEIGDKPHGPDNDEDVEDSIDADEGGEEAAAN